MTAGNPLIRRYRYSLMRPRQFWIYTSIYIATLLMIFLINYSGYQTEEMYKTTIELYQGLFYQFVVLQVVVLWLWGAFNSGSAITEEVVDKTYDFFRMLPVSARAKAVGILVGKNLIVLLAAACNFVFMAVFGIAGRINIKLISQAALVLASVAILANSVALLSSINPKGKKSKTGIIGLIVLAFFLGPVIIGVTAEFARAQGFESAKGKFFELDIPVLILVSLVVLYFSCWSIKGILRMFTREDEPLFTRKGAYLFMLGYEFVISGLFYHYLAHPDISFEPGLRAVNFVFWLTSLIPALMISLASTRNFDKYLEFAGIFAGRSGRKLSLPRLVLFSNLSLGLGLFAIWAAVAALTTYLAGFALAEHFIIMGVILSFYLFLLLLSEVYVVISPYTSKIGLLLVFIVIAYAIFPLIFSGILEIYGIAPHSPLGYFGYMFDQWHRNTITDVRVAAVNLLLCIAPIVVVVSRYRNVINARQQMMRTSS